VLSQEEPNAHEEAADLIGQELPDAAFDADGVGGFGANGLGGVLGGQERRGSSGVESVEFFFEGRDRR
jgi:hypothetical protein